MTSEPQKTVDELGLTIESEFVPFSRSRNAKVNPKLHERSLNWRCTLKRFGRVMFSFDYSAGVAHCPAYRADKIKLGTPNSVDRVDETIKETETGRTDFPSPYQPLAKAHARGVQIEPDTLDVIFSLVTDAEAGEHPHFEDWADSVGLDTDSRKAEAAYKACVETFLQLRVSLGDSGFEQLRNAFEDF
jgi:hypothetical protein